MTGPLQKKKLGKKHVFNIKLPYFTKLWAELYLFVLFIPTLDESLFKAGINEFTFALPKSGNTITFKLLTHGDEKKIEAEIKGLQKVNPNGSFDVTTRLKHMITSINGDREQKNIRDSVDNYLLAPDARALREYYSKVQPDVDLKFIPEDESYVGEGITVPISLNFFWPDA